MKKVQIYTDGACSGNPGPGAAAALLIYGEARRPITHVEKETTTNSRMEMMAVIIGLEALKEPCEVEVFSDSNLVVQGINTWMEGWAAKGWRKSDGKPVENQDLWVRIQKMTHTHKIKGVKVAGHSGNQNNELVNDLAQNACPKLAFANA